MYQHYKGGYYYTLGITTQLEGAHYLVYEKHLRATHTETGERVNVFMQEGRFYVLHENHAQHMLYVSADGEFWLRPKDMFFGNVMIDDIEFPRFRLIG